jgi:[protein-PII] uridylyltransferase
VARQSFLSESERSTVEVSVKPYLKPIDGRVESGLDEISKQVSSEMEKLVIAKFMAMQAFEAAKPVVYGSLAEKSLCPKSDLDFIFLGQEHDVAAFVKSAQELGIKLRARVPVNRDNWTEGVEAFDVIALLSARAIFKSEEQQVLAQQKIILEQKRLKRSLIADVLKERKSREGRYQDISNLLEPNIKYGAGGLRDIHQGLVLTKMYPELFGGNDHAVELLNYYKEFFVLLRQKMHLLGMNDVLDASHQIEIAKWFGFTDHRSFMREVQKGLSRSAFYSKWMISYAYASDNERRQLVNINLKSLKGAADYLREKPNELRAMVVRSQMDRLFKETIPSSKEKGRFLETMLSEATNDRTLQLYFACRLVDKVLPNLNRLFGWVQHDQYHRFTADVHLMQCCREVKRFRSKPSLFLQLRKALRPLSELDWKIISFAALYHDQAKGLSGDHEKIGEQLVENDLKDFGFSEAIVTEVKWLVRYHLIFSEATFRKNPAARATWDYLISNGVEGDRIDRLAAFTAIDICATNPEAWNEWKSKAMFQLVRTLKSSEVQQSAEFRRYLARKGLEFSGHFAQLDTQMLEMIPFKYLVADADPEFGFQVNKGDSKNSYWVRFFSRRDKTGTFLRVVNQLYLAGLSVRHAFIHSVPDFGVYDLFEVNSARKLSLIKTQLEKTDDDFFAELNVKYTANKIPVFSDVDLVEETDTDWIISLKAKDQSGLLLRAAEILVEQGCNIKWAKVHTWGRQIEDVFCIQPLKGTPVGQFISELKSRLTSESNA